MNRRGFTLVEALLAIVLLLALTATMGSFVWGMMGSRDRLAEATTRGREWSRLVSLVGGAVLASSAESSGATFSGDSARVRIPTHLMRMAEARGQMLEVRYEASARRVMASRGDASEEIASNVSAMVIRYWDGRAWTEEFDAAQRGGMPAAIEVSIWIGDEERAVGEAQRTPDCWRVFAVPDGGIDGAASSGGGES